MFNINKLSKEFNNGAHKIMALNNFSYRIYKKGFYIVLGPSGSGKSTLLNILAGLDDEYEGEVIYQNKNLNLMSESKINSYRSKNIGIISQTSYLIPYLNVQQNISIDSKIIDKDIINNLGITQLLNRDVSKLSGGQKQRVCLARALMHNPSILLADEPTGALDSNNAKILMKILKKESQDKLVIMVTHDLDLAYKYGDILLFLKDGMLVKEEIINDIKANKSNLTNSKKRKKFILKLSLLYMKYKKKRLSLTAICCSIGLIGVILSLVLTEGFTNFFQKQFENSINANVIYGYNENNKEIKTSSLLDVQKLAIENNLEWGVFYSLSEEVNQSVKINNKEIDWLSLDNLMNYRYNPDLNIKSTQSCALRFPREYLFIFSNLFGKNFTHENEVDKYIQENKVSFTFNFILDKEYNINLELENIIWSNSNNIEIYHNSKFLIEDLAYSYNFIIDEYIESSNIIRYPYLVNVNEEQKDIILKNNNYKNMSFSWDNEYLHNKISICYEGVVERVTISRLLSFLKYPEIIDYLYLSSNGVDLDQTIPNISINQIKGRNISFYPFDLKKEEIKDQYILYGNVPKNNKEIIVSKKLFNELNINLDDKIKIYHQLKKETAVKVVGYIEGNDNYLIYQQGSWTYDFFINELQLNIKDLPCYQISLIMSNSDVIPYYLSFLSSLEKEITFISPLYEATREIQEMLNYFKSGILVLSIFSVIVSILLLGTVIFINTIEQKKNDAILYIQGYSKKEIIMLHLIQNIGICLLSYLITFISSFLIVIEINTIFSLMLEIDYYNFAIVSSSFLLKVFYFLLFLGALISFVTFKIINVEKPLKILKE